MYLVTNLYLNTDIHVHCTCVCTTIHMYLVTACCTCVHLISDHVIRLYHHLKLYRHIHCTCTVSCNSPHSVNKIIIFSVSCLLS